MADDVQLTDLQVIQRYSLAVRSATAPREELMASLQADLDWLRDGRRAPAGSRPRTRPGTMPARAARAAAAAPIVRSSRA